MSRARKHFWSVVARSNGAVACPRKYGMNWFIPALVSRRPDSGGGISGDEGTRLWSRASKKRRNVSRIRSPSMTAQSIGGSVPDRRASGGEVERVAQPLAPKGLERDRGEPAVVDQDHVSRGHGQVDRVRGHLAALPERRPPGRRQADPGGAVRHDRRPA